MDVSLSKNHRVMPPEAAAQFRELVIQLYYNTRPEFLNTQAGEKDLANVLHARLEIDRKSVVPWLNATLPLDGAEVLEIGCGTGSSTLALAEQGARVVGVDILERSIRIAKERCRLHGVENVEFVLANASELPAEIRQRRFDWIIFFAALEHMTYHERIKSISDTWSMLPPGGLLCCVDTPNRLWYMDSHTSHMPFFNWLPDDLAIRYAKFCRRTSFTASFGDFEPTPEKTIRLIRAGRGVSFHEFELAIAPVQKLEVASCRDQWLLKRLTGDLPLRGAGHKFIGSLLELLPDIHPAWFFGSLDVAIRKT